MNQSVARSGICRSVSDLWLQLFRDLVALAAIVPWLVCGGAVSAQGSGLVTQEIRYAMPDAGEVVLVWGVNGWQQAPEQLRPARTTVRDMVLHTPMVQEGDDFVVKLTVPAGTTLDYCFMIAKKRGDFSVTWPLCDGDYRTVSESAGVARHRSLVTLTLIDQEVRYRSPDADEVYLVWGLKGWHVVPETLRPRGTTVINKVMRTPMERKGDSFALRVRVPQDSPLDYGFLITRKRGSSTAVDIWDGDHRANASARTPLDVTGKALEVLERQVRSHAITALVTQTFRFHMPEAGEVVLVWGVNGWGLVPEDLRPEGTVLWKNVLMNTPMQRDGGTFIVSVRVPANAPLDYGFQVRTAKDGTPVWLWDGDYRTQPAQDGIVQEKASLFGLRLFSLRKMRGLAASLFLGLCILWGVLFLFWKTRLLAQKLRAALFFLGVNITFFVVFFCFGEAYLRFIGTEQYQRTFPGQFENNPDTAEWGQVDATLGWAANKAYAGINAQGFRDRKDYSRPALIPGLKRVLVLGDSFIWGHGVSPDENVPSLLERRYNNEYEFYNISAPGWGIDQMYLGYRQYKDILQPQVVMLFFVDDDVPRVLEAYRGWEGKNKPSFRLEDDRLAPRLPRSTFDHYVDSVMQESVLFGQLMREVYLIMDAAPIVRHIVGTIAEEARQRQQHLVVVRIPTKLDSAYANTFNRWLLNLERASHDAGALYLDPADEFEREPNWMTTLYLDDIGGHLFSGREPILGRLRLQACLPEWECDTLTAFVLEMDDLDDNPQHPTGVHRSDTGGSGGPT